MAVTSPSPTKSFLAITITLTAATATNLFDKMQTALTAAEGGVVPSTGREITIQNDPNSPAEVLIGDAKVLSSPQRCGTYLGSGQAKTYRTSGVQSCPLRSIYVISSGAAVVNIEVWV